MSVKATHAVPQPSADATPLPEGAGAPRSGHPHAPAATQEQIQLALDQAKTVTTTHQGGRVELQLGHFCNNRCVFCGSGQLTERGQADPIPEPALLAVLQAVADQGMRRVTFLGGEPTIQDSFLPGLSAAVALGFSEITIFTNGARLWDERFMAAVEAAVAGVPAPGEPVDLQWRVSIQGGDAASHDRAVGRQGAFSKILKGLALVRRAGRQATVNMCLTSGSVATLPELADVLLAHGVQQVCIDMVRPISAGERTDDWMRAILPRFFDLAQPMHRLVERLHAADPAFDVNLTHVPYCVVPALAKHIHHGGEATVTFTADLAERQGVMDKYAFQATDRRRMDKCGSCVFAWRCTGVTHQYLDWHGEDEFTPQTAENLKEAGLLPVAIVDFARQALGNMEEGAAVGPWRLLSARFDPRLPRAELRWQGPDRGELFMGIAPQGDPLPPGRLLWWQFDGGQVDVAPTAGLYNSLQLKTLVEWFALRLGPASGLIDSQKLQGAARQFVWLSAALRLLVARDPSYAIHAVDAQWQVSWSSEQGPRWLRLAADEHSPVAIQQLDPGLAEQAQRPGDASPLAGLSAALGSCLRDSRSRRGGGLERRSV